MWSRRRFLTLAAGLAPAAGGAALGLTTNPGRSWLAGTDAEGALEAFGRQDLLRAAPRARFWTNLAQAGANCGACHTPEEKVDGRAHTHATGMVKCLLCAQGCVLKPSQRGTCRARINIGGELRSLVYGRPLTTQVDPIEKKPFYHFLPGASAFSLATSGCPLRCRFCQNWQLSQASPEDYEVEYTPPAAIAEAAAARRAQVIAFTYNEPTVFAEYALDIARAARAKGVRSVMVSCGFMTEAPLAEMCEAFDAIKIDLKGYSESFYRRVCSAELRPVLRSIAQIAKSKAHLEIVNLVVPTLNDSDQALRDLVGWVAGELGPDVPVHFTRFHPDYQLLNLPPTPVRTLERAWELARARGLRYAYVGNVPDHRGNHTYCPQCGKLVVERNGFFVTGLHVKNGRCEYCSRAIAGVWS